MTRNKVFFIVFAIAMILSLAIAPLTAVQVNTLAYTAQGKTATISTGSITSPILIACDGCSGGGSGPG